MQCQCPFKSPGSSPCPAPQPARSAVLQRRSCSSGAVHCCEPLEGRGDCTARSPSASFIAMWIPTEHEKYGVGECSRANFYHSLVLAPSLLAPRQVANARSWHCTAGPWLGHTGLRLRGERWGFAAHRALGASRTPSQNVRTAAPGSAGGVWSGRGACCLSSWKGKPTGFLSLLPLLAHSGRELAMGC